MIASVLVSVLFVGLPAMPARAQEPGQEPDQAAPSKAASKAASKPDLKKAKAAYDEGVRAEKQKDWETAFTAYTDALNYAPDSRDYAMRREIVKSQLVQVRVDAAERDAISGRLDEARRELLSASYVDPSNAVVRERLAEMVAAETGQERKKPDLDLGGEIHLAYKPGRRSFDCRGDTQAAYEQLARQFGVEAAFDVDVRSRQVRFHFDDVDFPTAARLLGEMTKTFWRPLGPRLFYVADDTPQKRKDNDETVIRTVLLPASETNDQMTEILRLVRDIAGITRSSLDTSTRTLTLRSTPQAIALAADLIDDLEHPTGELILEIEVLEVDRTSALELGITPPQTSHVYALSSQEVQEAEQSEAGLIAVIEEVFGTPSSISGLTSSEISGLLGAGQIGLSTLIPPVIAFGGGDSTFLATLPGLTANFGEMLSLVRDGRRILLRAQDGQPATFFVGERFPVALSQYGAGTTGVGGSIAGVSAANFPTTNFPTGVSPAFVTTAITRTGSTSTDLIVANSGDNPGDVGVLLGDGTGNFGTQTTYPAGTTPVSIAAGDFNGDGNVDLAVANQGSNNISILPGNGDGTFGAATTVAVGTTPVSVVTANFHDTIPGSGLDLAVANQADNSIWILQGNGNGTFQIPAQTVLQLPGGYKPVGLLAAQLTNSGHMDLAVADSGNATISVFLGNGDGTFGPRTDYAVGSEPVWISTNDFNGDTIPDLAVANSGTSFTASNGALVTGNSVSVLLGLANSAGAPTGTFGTHADYPAGTTPKSIITGDFTENGLADLVVAASGDNAVSILLNAGGGIFGSNFELPVETDPVSITSGEFDSTGNIDVALANEGSNDVSVILNTSTFSGSSSSSLGSNSAFPGIQYLDIGVKVKATPRIHANNEVTLQLAFDINSLSTQTYNTIPVINNQSVQQTVRLKENETAAVAGFHETQLNNAINGNPGLAQVAGDLDQNQNAQKSETELLILVTPRMVRLAPRTDHVIYAGQGALEGPSGAETPAAVPSPGARAPQPGPAPPPAQPPTSQAPFQPGPAPPPAQPGQPPAPPPEQPAPAPAQPPEQ